MGGLIKHLLRALRFSSAGRGVAEITARRNQALLQLAEYKKENFVCYYADNRDKPEVNEGLIEMNESDVDSMIYVCKTLPKDNLNLILHSPGGDIDAAAQLVSYCNYMFKSFRVIVPRTAMSAATMLACSADEIVMAPHSFLGPTDVHIKTLESNTRKSAPLLYQRIQNFLTYADHTELMQNLKEAGDFNIEVAEAYMQGREMVQRILFNHMFKRDPAKLSLSNDIAVELSDRQVHRSHGAPLDARYLRELGLNIIYMEEDPLYYDLVMKSFDATRYQFNNDKIAKIIFSHEGTQVTVDGS